MSRDWKTQCGQGVNFFKLIYRMNVIPIKIPMSYFLGNEKDDIKFVWKHRESRIAKMILNKNKI